MPPAANGRRTRRVAPVAAPVNEAPLPAQDEIAPVTRRKRASASEARRVQAATSEDKVRVPHKKRAVETDKGDIKAPLAGKYFKLTESIGLMPLMEWAASLDQVDVRNAAQLSSFYRLLRALVHPDDWDAFRQHATEEKSTDEELLAFYTAAIEAMAARPTREPATS